MSFDERSYSGRLFRPTPEVYFEEDLSFGVIATPWGNRQGAKKTIELMRDWVQSAKQDLEATSPFQKLTCLSPLANSLRAAVMLSNDAIYREENKAEYTCGVELLAFARAENELAFVQVGAPNLYLARAGWPWMPLTVQMDLSAELSVPPKFLPPLPQNLIGLHTTTNLNVASMRVLPGDKLIALSHTIASNPLFHLPFERTTLEGVTARLSTEYPDLPFWVGVFGL